MEMCSFLGHPVCSKKISDQRDNKNHVNVAFQFLDRQVLTMANTANRQYYLYKLRQSSNYLLHWLQKYGLESYRA